MRGNVVKSQVVVVVVREDELAPLVLLPQVMLNG